MFSPQIHIVFNCEEEDRITKPLLEYPPNKLYYFIAFIKLTGQKDVNIAFYERNIKLLQKNIPNLEIITSEVDYLDYDELIRKLSIIIREERNKNPKCSIYFNASTGSNLCAIASIEASKAFECKYYYTTAEIYDPHGDGPHHKGKVTIFFPTTFPIQKPPIRHVQILQLINRMINKRFKGKLYDISKEKAISLKELVNALHDKGLIPLKKKHPDPKSQTSALYMNARTILMALEKKFNYIRLLGDRRYKKVCLTQSGKEIVNFFTEYY